MMDAKMLRRDGPTGMTGRQHLAASRHAAVSLLFAIAIIPIMMLIGLAIDFGFYNEAQTQLNMAADAASLHAARVAALLNQQNDPNYLTEGQAAGQAWFAAQEGNVPQVNPGSITPTITLTAPSANTVLARVSYGGYVQTHFARLFPANWSGYPNWGITGAATALISVPRYTEVQMLIDNSSSMMIAATDTYIKQMESLTPCSQEAENGDNQTIDFNYSWAYSPSGGAYHTNPPASAYSYKSPADAPQSTKIPYGYGTFYYQTVAKTVNSTPDITPPPPAAPGIGQCDADFLQGGGPPDECLYPLAMLTPPSGPVVNSNGQCVTNGVVSGGGPGSLMTDQIVKLPAGATAMPNMPQAPCAFACHNVQPPANKEYGLDYYGLARRHNILLRYDVVHQAAANVITKMSQSASNGELSVGVFEFNAPGVTPNGIQQVYPAADPSSSFSATEAGSQWAMAQSDTKSVEPPVTQNGGDTYFENAMSQLAGFVAPAGAGAAPNAPIKNLFIVTDGMDDYKGPNGRYVGPIDPSAPGSCDHFKAPVSQGGLGYTIYVLYIQYFPLPNPYYLSHAAAYVQPPAGSPVYNALQACASQGDFYVSSDGTPDSINAALQSMLASAIGSAGRYTQ